MQQPVVQIDVDKPVRRRTRQRTQLVVVALVLLVLLGGLTIAARTAFDAPEQPDAAAHRVAQADTTSLAPVEAPSAVTTPDEAKDDGNVEELVDDDGRVLWASPTDGEPVRLSWLPAGCQVFVVLRPAALLAHPEGDKVLAALGPTGQLAIANIERAVAVRFDAIERLLVGLRATPTGQWRASYVVEPTSGVVLDEVMANLFATPIKYGGAEYRQVGEYAYYVATTDETPLLVVAPATDMAEVLELGGASPPLRRDMERLFAASDRQRHATFFFAPNYLAADGRSVFDGVGRRLKDPLGWFLGDGLTAVALSLHWGDDFFMELRAASTIDTRPHHLAEQLAQRIDELPARVEEHVFGLQLAPYGRRLVARLPEMVRAAVRYTRYDFEQDHAVVRTYLPIAAGHNLLMASELALVEPPQATATIAPRASEENATIEQRLARVTSLSFSRDTLEAALAMLSNDIGVPIEISGQDLQLEGITKNQSFGIDLHNRPAAQILAEILRLANPDKSAAGLDDPRQKLVYVLRETPPGIVVTTRLAAERRGDKLPRVFRGQQ